ncbi:hypothetical protein D9M68_793610 [compost metagenome]
MLARQIAAHAHRPGIVGIGRLQPDQLVGLQIQALDQFIALFGVLPHGGIGAFEKERAIAGVFRVDVDLSGEQRLAHDAGAAKLDAVLDGHPSALQRLVDQLPQHRALGIDLRGDHHAVASECDAADHPADRQQR